MTILEDLWFGNVCPCDQMGSGDLEEVCKWENLLQASLNEEQWKIFLQYESAQNKQEADREALIFASGVGFGVRFLLACINT